MSKNVRQSSQTQFHVNVYQSDGEVCVSRSGAAVAHFLFNQI